MQKSYEKSYLTIEKNSPWFIKRRDLVFSLIANKNKEARILDYGCGSGATLSYLKTKGFTNLEGFEISDYLISNKKSKVKIITDREVLNKKRYDIILVMDVIEHIKDDKEVMQKISKLLSPGGTIIVSVPALMLLWSQHDVLNKHYRRYNVRELKKIMPKDILQKRMFYWNSILFLPSAIVKMIKKAMKTQELRSDFDDMSSISNFILSLCLRVENFAISCGINPFIGTSLFFIGEKKNE